MKYNPYPIIMIFVVMIFVVFSLIYFAYKEVRLQECINKQFNWYLGWSIPFDNINIIMCGYTDEDRHPTTDAGCFIEFLQSNKLQYKERCVP